MLATLVRAGAAMALSWLATAAAAQDLDVMSYYVNQIPNTCSADDYRNGGTFYRQYREATSQCPGLAVYHSVKGSPSPWSFVSGYVENGYFKLMDEVFVGPGGAMSDFRVFRDVPSGRKGIIDFAVSLPPAGVAWSHPPSVEEHWVDDAGRPSCAATHPARVDEGSSAWGFAWDSGTWTGWLQDRRAASPNKTVWHDVRTVTVAQYWGASWAFPLGRFVESYTYGRWRNPVNGAWYGVGLMKWQCVDQATGGSCGLGEKHYLVDCSVRVSCSTCPP